MDHIRTLEISTQRSIDRWLTIPTTIWDHFSPPLSIIIWNTLPAATLDQPNIAKFKDELDRFYWLYSKMSLTVFIDFIYIYIVNRFNSISVFNSHSLGMQCMYVFFFFFFLWYGIIILYPRDGYRLCGLIK